MRFYNIIAQAQSKAGAFPCGFSGKEWLKILLLIIMRVFD
jgi:hypothetical protein